MGIFIAFVVLTVAGLQTFDMIFGKWCAWQAANVDEAGAKRLAYIWRGADFVAAAAFLIVFWNQIAIRASGAVTTIVAVLYTIYLVFGPTASLLTIHIGDQSGYFREIRGERL